MRSLIVVLCFSFFGSTAVFAEEVTTPSPNTESVTPPAPVKREPARIPSAAEAEALREGELGRSSRFGFFLGGDANFGKDVNFNNVSFTENGANTTGTATMNANLAAAIRAGIEMMPVYGFGFQASVAIQTPRPVSAINQNFAFASAPATNSNSSIQLNILELDGVYRWNQFYTLAGINYSIPVASNFGISNASYTFSGFIGGQVGVGAIFYDQLHLELLFDVTSMHMSSSGTDTGGVAYTEDFGTGTIMTGEIRAHWTF